jgi:hypothetical protein
MNNDLRWMTVKQAKQELEDGELCWYSRDGAVECIEFHGSTYRVFGRLDDWEWTRVDKHRARICRALVPQPPTNVGKL